MKTRFPLHLEKASKPPSGPLLLHIRTAAPSFALLAGIVLGADPFLAPAASVDLSKLPPAATAAVDFDRDIRPLLDRSCLRCHGPERPRSHFRLDTREDALKGGENGRDILPGASRNSPLVHYIAGLVEEMEMPPPGKAPSLTAPEISLIRAWIDQGAAWGTNASVAPIEVVIAPVVGWTFVSGDEKKFREHYWRQDGPDGGIEKFSLTDHITRDTTATVEGHAAREDYLIDVRLEKRDIGFTRFGWQQYRKYYDDSGGYFPGFHPAVFDLNRDLHTDQGRAWADVGLTLPNWPRMVIGYEYQYREGSKSTLEWGGVTEGVTRNIYPAAKRVDEHVHIVKFDLEHEIGGVRIADTFRGEFYDLETGRRDLRSYPAPSRVDVVRETSKYFEGANSLRLEKSFTDWFAGSAGYLYSKLDGDATFSLDTVFPSGPPDIGDRWRSHPVVLTRESHVFNLSTLLGPWQGLSLAGGLLNEWTEQDGFGRGTMDIVLPGPLVLRNPERFDMDIDRMLMEEMAVVRYTTIPFTTLFAEARMRQEEIGEREDTTGLHELVRDSDLSTRSSDLRGGFNSSPWRPVSFGAEYRRADKQADTHDFIDRSAHDAYPAFLRWRDTSTDEIEGRFTVHPSAWLKTSISYKYTSTDYRLSTDRASENALGDISPGGRIDAAEYKSHSYGLSTTFTPWRQLFVTIMGAYENGNMTTASHHNPSIAAYDGDTISLVASATYAVTTNTDLHASYSFSWADYGQSNFSDGLPRGIRYDKHAVTTGIKRRFCRNGSAGLQYGFYRYAEPSSGGHNDYDAHAIFATLVLRLP